MKRGVDKKIIYSVVIFAVVILSIILFYGGLDLINKMTGKISETASVNMNITITAGNAPVVTYIANISPLTLNEGPSNTNVSINFTVVDSDGASNVNDSSATINLTKSGQSSRINATCLKNLSTGNIVNYTCTIAVWWYDGDGIWAINASIKDVSNNYASNNSYNFTINTLKGLKSGPSALPFGSISPGATNQTATDSILLNNTGNQAITDGNIDINSTDLLGETDNTKGLRSGNFSVGNITGTVACNITAGNTSASRMNTTSGNFADVIGTTLPAGNFTLNNNATGQERLYFCLLQAGSELSAQQYSTSSNGAWTIRIA